MLFNSYIFFIFLAVVLPIYYLLPKNLKKIHLVLASYLFYGYWDWRFCLLLAFSTVLDYFVGLIIFETKDEKKRKFFFTLSICINLAFLGFFKYFNFFIDSFKDLAGGFGQNLDFLHLNVVLPIGISFYTFQSMSYAIDIYRRKLNPTRSFVDYSLFVCFFPQLVAGPIQRATDLLPQIIDLKKPTRLQIEQGIVLIITGLFKKVMIGDTTGRIVDQIFGNQTLYSSGELLMALVLFSIQIYADFSGYSSIARGTSKLLGVELIKNFNQPYLSANITEFWRRWHISLSTWLRDYLYISLGGNRKGNVRTYVNLFITMLLGGLWHGANWTFLVWGALHGIYLAIHKSMTEKEKISDHFIYKNIPNTIIYGFKILGTYLLVLFAWLFFRVRNFSEATYFLTKMIHWESGEYFPRLAGIAGSFMALILIYDGLEYYTKSHTFLLRLRPKAAVVGILTVLFVVVMFYIFQAEPLPFIYFQF